jgi:protein phosphatase
MKYFTYTNIGPRDINEDSFFATIKEDILYACVADGVGGMNYGNIASAFVTKSFEETLTEFKDNPLLVSDYINNNLTAYINNKLSGTSVATTFTAGAINNHELHGVHVGDSRICVLRGNGIKQITEEHNEVGRLVREGKLSIEDKKFYPRKHIIEYIMGNMNLYNPQKLFFQLETSDRLIFSTDGFHDTISKKEIRDISITNSSFEQFNRQLIIEIENRVLKDNTTYISVEI